MNVFRLWVLQLVGNGSLRVLSLRWVHENLKQKYTPTVAEETSTPKDLLKPKPKLLRENFSPTEARSLTLPRGSKVVPFWGSYIESYKVIRKRNYYGAYGYTENEKSSKALQDTVINGHTSKGCLAGCPTGSRQGSLKPYVNP